MQHIQKKIILSVLLLFTIITCTNAARKVSPAIILKSEAKENAILLRWYPNNAESWEATNQSGFIIERYTRKKDGITLRDAEKTVLTSEPITMKPFAEWRNEADNNDMAAVMVRAIFKENFSKSTYENVPLISNEKMQDSEQRYMYAMQIADLDFDLACMAGLGWVDKTAQKNDIYEYHVFPANEALSQNIKRGITTDHNNTYDELPESPALRAVEGDLSVNLSWNQSPYYVAYYIEKSEDGEYFYRIFDIPLLEKDKNKAVMSYLDDLAANRKLYYYQLRGISAFGETGPASQPILVTGQSALQSPPKITTVRPYNSRKEIEISWEFNEKDNELISGFEIRMANSLAEAYDTTPEKANSYVRRITLPYPEQSSYITVTAVPKRVRAEKRTSTPVLVQFKNSTLNIIRLEDVSTIIYDYNSTNDGVLLKWASESPDNVLHNITKEKIFRAEGDNPFSQIAEISLKQGEIEYLDKTVQKGKTYRYIVKAVDVSGQEYLPSPEITVER